MFDLLDAPMPGDVTAAIAQRMTARRKERGLSQPALAERSGVSLGSIRRFEQIHEISLSALVRIAFALDCEQDFDALFAQPHYGSIDDVIAAAKHDRSRS
ncbi:helix-turn-helix domain-containing protein [Bifidobacterium samirii]|uniref:Toxin-antitoxin system, antitoxin component, Xre family n=1 Tax=Bifidobacterium samirii TaxID=2306974 RepID=A0A430FUR7_9BIFI|nr:helix-turn-helix transcriptional regulator [Bifidobacterium samirii]RSX57221.1 toxin-antitoxin system, antitoxin component, Xre family [Bifidobacterium samirii]